MILTNGKLTSTVGGFRTTIGFGSRDQGTLHVHGNPLEKDETIAIKKLFGFNPDELFVIPEETKTIYDAAGKRGATLEYQWQKLFTEWGQMYPAEAVDVERRLADKLPTRWERSLPRFTVTDKAVATRKVFETILTNISVAVPELVSGSADLTPSNLCVFFPALHSQFTFFHVVGQNEMDRSCGFPTSCD